MNYTETEKARAHAIQWLEAAYAEILRDNCDEVDWLDWDERDRESALALARTIWIARQDFKAAYPDEGEVIDDWLSEKLEYAMERAELRAVDEYIKEEQRKLAEVASWFHGGGE